MSMLISSRLLPSVMSSASMTMYENNNINRSQQTSLIPPTSLPKYFNVPFAIQHGYFRCIRYLLELNYDPNERDNQLRTPLVLCSYVESDRWSLSLAQNLLEKGAKIALDDHARRNAMHHACALQRLHLVQLYLSCLDFNIEAQDSEGNTCLHYVAITGNSEIAELIIRSAEKLGVRLEQYVNREGCSAAVLALKYGHIECANQITHRDWDEFFVIPRPLSIYETPPTTDDNQTTTTTTTSKKKTKRSSNHFPPTRTETRPLTLSFGLLKIIFNDGDTGYSTRLAGLCKQEKQTRHLPHTKHKKQEAPQTSTTTISKLDRTKSTIVNGIQNYSTEALVNGTQLSNLTKERPTSYDNNGNLIHSNRTSPRMKLLMQQHSLNQSNSKETNSSNIQKPINKTQLSVDELNRPRSYLFKNDFEEIKSKMSTPTIYQQVSSSTLNHSEHNTSATAAATTTMRKFQRPKTAIVRNQKYLNPPPTRLNSPKIKTRNPSAISTKKKPLLINRMESVSNIPQLPLSSTIGSESSGYAARPVSAVVHRAIPRSNDSAGSIREATGTASRFNKPEELFGLRPEELFASEQHQPKILDPRSTTKPNENTRSKRNQFQKQQPHIWQQDVDKIIELYNIHHSANYRKSAVPPLGSSSTHAAAQTDTRTDSSQGGRVRRSSITKTPAANTSKGTTNPKQSTFAVLNIPRRNSFSRSTIKLTNT